MTEQELRDLDLIEEDCQAQLHRDAIGDEIVGDLEQIELDPRVEELTGKIMEGIGR